MKHPIRGVHAAAATPVTRDRKPDLALFCEHCLRLLADGCHGIALLGTTGEANSFGLVQRMELVEAAIDAGIPPGALLPGTTAPSVADTVTLTAHAVRAGVKGVVMLPPYYYKGVSGEGLFRFYAAVIEGVADDRLRIVLYHIPQVSQVPIGYDLIDRLLRDFPGIVVGIKDSSGDLENMLAMCRRFPSLGVLAGADPLMLPVLQAGGAGCITATSNLCAADLRIVWDGWADPARAAPVSKAQDRIKAWRALSERHALIQSVKAMLALRDGNDTWLNMMPPLTELPTGARAELARAMDRLDA